MFPSVIILFLFMELNSSSSITIKCTQSDADILGTPSQIAANINTCLSDSSNLQSCLEAKYPDYIHVTEGCQACTAIVYQEQSDACVTDCTTDPSSSTCTACIETFTSLWEQVCQSKSMSTLRGTGIVLLLALFVSM